MVVAPRADVILDFSLSLLGFWHAFRIWVVSDKEGRGKELIFLAVAFSRSSLFLLRGEAADDL